MVSSFSPSLLARRLWRGFWALILTLVLVLHLGGGWYFSGVLINDAFEVDPNAPVYDVEVTAIDSTTIGLRAAGGEEPDLSVDGVFGFETPSGFLQVSNIITQTGDTVVRDYTVLNGTAPVVGDLGDLTGFAFPANPTETGLDIEIVSYDTTLGPMDAWLLDGSRSDWVIYVHGKGSSPREAFRLMHALDDAGFHQLAISYRNDPGQPPDPSGYYQYGRTEWEELVGAVDYAQRNGAKRVVLVGYSTGGAIILSYLYKADRSAIKAVILDAPNISMGRTVDYGASQRDLAFGIPLPPTLTAAAKFITALRVGVNWELIDYLERSGNLSLPTLVFHGTADDTVPIETSRELAERRSDLVTLIEVPGAPHVGSWNVDPETYEVRVLDFINNTLR